MRICRIRCRAAGGVVRAELRRLDREGPVRSSTARSPTRSSSAPSSTRSALPAASSRRRPSIRAERCRHSTPSPSILRCWGWSRSSTAAWRAAASSALLTRHVSPAIERSTYMLCTSLVLIVLFAFWQPIRAVVWHIDNLAIAFLVLLLSMAGWSMVLYSTFLVGHFELFGLKNVRHPIPISASSSPSGQHRR